MRTNFILIRVSCLVALLGLTAATGPVYKTQVEPSSAATSSPDELTTQTVYGFLDFTTTIANTVMVFSPQSQSQKVEIKPTPSVKVEQTKPPSSSVETSSSVSPTSDTPPPPQSSVVTSVKVSPSKTQPSPPPVAVKKEKDDKINKVLQQGKSLHVNPHPASKVSEASKKKSPPPPVHAKTNDIEPVKHVEASLENNLELEQDLSKAPSEKLSETYKIIEVASTAKSRHEPTGLVTKLGGTIVKDGLTTVHETSVIGTYIGGKYAQILKSSSHVVHKPVATPVPKGIRPTKTVLEPTVLEDSLPLEALFTAPVGQNLVRHSRRPVVSPPFKNRLQRTKPPPTAEPLTSDPPTEKPPQKKHSKHSGSRPAFKLSHNRFSKSAVSSSSEVPTVSVFPESTRRYHRQRSASSTLTSNNIESGSGRRFKPKPTAVQVEPSTSLYKFKLSRPQGRWQYKTTPKPRVPIRRQDGQEENQAIQSTPSLPDIEVSEEQQAENVEVTATPTPSLPIHTIKVEISTPANFSNVYYEIATIKSPYTFQVGTVKNTRYITLTSTFEKLLIEPTSTTSSEPLTENILTSSPTFDNERTIVTLPAIAIAAGETLPLETMTDTFSTSEILLKTHLLPVVRDSNTTTLTLVQTYEVTKVVSATKTLPPTELFQFIPSKTLNEFNTRLDEAGSELHLELEFGDNDNDEEQRSVAVLPDYPNATIVEETPSSTTNSPPPFQEQLSPEKLQQLALLRLLNPNQPPIVTTTPILSVQTIYETHVIPFFNGLSTVQSTISRPVKTITNTQYTTSTLPLPSLPIPFLPTPQLQPMITSSPVVTQTVVTATQSKVLKLTFGAKTAYTTLYSTTVVPTLLTTYLTTQLAVQPTAGLNSPFPSPFFPAFNPFQFVG